MLGANMSAQTKFYPESFQQQVIAEVKQHNRLISDVAKQYCISAKTVYQWVKNKETAMTSKTNAEGVTTRKRTQAKQKSALVSEIAHLQLKLSQLNQQLLSINSN
ncbi:hypothetical protein BCU91_10325 [Shewanella sp. 10N.286.52.B9]|nr:hypothetical protein BCU91_10325 [Shewanella sp. 10N.286.52.B9]PMH85111.1 hypothetical protein BCU57_15525 [Shewanella sp. 10N.286.48.B5]PMH97998.1 hypothetical protein BCU55_16845 [Shewanella sp. 10N.286.48.A6]